MEDKGRKGGKSPPLDPKWYALDITSVGPLLNRQSLQDALRTFFQPIKNGDPRLDFYTMYKKEATEYDADYIKKYDDDLNTTLIFVRLLQLAPATFLLVLTGGSVLCRQFCFRHRFPLGTTTRPE